MSVFSMSIQCLQYGHLMEMTTSYTECATFVKLSLNINTIIVKQHRKVKD